MPSGYYWCYQLRDDGEPLYPSPDIVWYSSERNDILLHGYDLSITYDPTKYRLLERIEYNER